MMQEKVAGGGLLYIFVSDLLKENCYLLAEGRKCLLIDPGIDCEKRVEECILRHGYEPCGIVLTHAHYDHVAGAGWLGERFSVPVVLHREDRKVLAHAAMYARCFSGVEFQRPKEVCWMEGESRLPGNLAGFGLHVLHVPGHTPGGVALFYRDLVFTGDTLLYESLAQAKLPEENREDLLASVDLLLKEAVHRKACTIYPGHGAKWDVGEAWEWWQKCPEKQKRR